MRFAWGVLLEKVMRIGLGAGLSLTMGPEVMLEFTGIRSRVCLLDGWIDR